MTSYRGCFVTVKCYGGDPEGFTRQGLVVKQTENELIVLGISGCTYRGNPNECSVIEDENLWCHPDVLAWLKEMRESPNKVAAALAIAPIGD